MTRHEIFSKIAEGATAPAFLTGVGVAGTVATAVLTGRACTKMERMIETEERRRIRESEPVQTVPIGERIAMVWPEFVPPIAVGVTTILAIVLANHESAKKVMALTAAAGVSERALTEYKNKVAEKLTKPKATQVQDEIAQERIANNPPTRDQQIIVAGVGEVLCYDMSTDRYFQSTMEKIRQAENAVNHEIVIHNYASLSFFYDHIGLRSTSWSDIVGWNGDHICRVLYSTTLTPDDRPCIAIDFDTHPQFGYNNLYG